MKRTALWGLESVWREKSMDHRQARACVRHATRACDQARLRATRRRRTQRRAVRRHGAMLCTHDQATRHTASRCDQLTLLHAADFRDRRSTACCVYGGACSREHALCRQSFLGVKPRASTSALRFAFMRITVFRTVAFGSDRAHRLSRARNAALVSLPAGSHSAIFASICVHRE